MIISVHQPNYIPWIGFFDKMDKSNVFVILDCPSFNKRGYTHRNRIKTPNGELLLTVPLQEKDKPIKDVVIAPHQPWKSKHIGSLEKNYIRSAYWKQHRNNLVRIYEQAGTRLIELTLPMLFYMKTALGIKTPVVLESELGQDFGTGSARIAGICKHLGADVYLSGQGAHVYNEEAIFQSHGITLLYQNFRHPEYAQLWGPFAARLSALDLLFNCGPESLSIIRKYNP